MKPFPVKADKIMARGDKESVKKGQEYFKVIQRKSKRQAYIRSAYFEKQKIFFTYFWKHLYQKPPRIRRLRIKFLPCAIELIQKSRNEPIITQNPAKKSEIFYRFYGTTRHKEMFYVQIKENVRTGRKELMSIVNP